MIDTQGDSAKKEVKKLWQSTLIIYNKNKTFGCV